MKVLLLMFELVLSVMIVTVVPEETRPTTFESRWITRPPNMKEFPYAIYIVTSNADEDCSGTLVSTTWVLTAARCMYQNHTVVEHHTSLTLYAGVEDRKDLENPNVQKRTSRQLQIYKNSSMNSFYSLALVEVDPPFTIQTGANRIVGVLEVSSYGFASVDEPICKTGSYGSVNWGEEGGRTVLKKLEMDIKACCCSEVLEEAFPNTPTGHWICGMSEISVGVCSGDFGAGLVCDAALKGVAVDLVSFKESGQCQIKDKDSHECGNHMTFSVYLDVCYYLHWISSHVSFVRLNRDPCDHKPDSAQSARVVRRELLALVVVVGLVNK